MSRLFSPKNKYTIWRKLWIALAKGEKTLGLPVTDAQIAQMEKECDHFDKASLDKHEEKTRHDVMAHILSFGEQAPEAKGIIHLGATSAFVQDNGDLIQIKQGLILLQQKCAQLLRVMGKLAKEYADIPTLGYTHFQAAQPVTVGKRISLWLQDFLFDLKEMTAKADSLPFLGAKGATGTQSSFYQLFNEDEEKVEQLDQFVAKEMGFTQLLPLSGQTYTRKIDITILDTLASFAASAHKCGTDLRLLAHLGEIREKKEKEQVGSSAMPHKQNPILAERLCSLSRFLISLRENPSYTLATQWLERSLDDSANRRIVIAEGFLAADALLNLLLHIFSNLSIQEDQIAKHLQETTVLWAMENVLMTAVKNGMDRQEAHEMLRKHPEAIQEIAKKWGIDERDLRDAFTPQVGMARKQVESFLKDHLDPYLKSIPTEDIDTYCLKC